MTNRKKQVKKHTLERCLAASEGCNGNISAIAERLGCYRTTVYRLMQRFPEFKDKVYDDKTIIHDRIEQRLEDKILSGDAHHTTEIFYLKTQMHYRGYGQGAQRVEVKHTGMHTDLVDDTFLTALDDIYGGDE